MILKRHLDPDHAEALVGMFLGKHLGTGAYRDVYAHRFDKTLVIKIEREGGEFANVREWDVWNYACYIPSMKRWLAPCVEISPCGRVLLQKRTEPITADEMPRRIPAFLTDEKPDNWGRLGRKIVAHDYGIVLPQYPLRLKQARGPGRRRKPSTS